MLYSSLDFYISIIETSAADFSKDELQILNLIKKNLPRINERSSQLRFELGSKRKDLFYIDGSMKSAVTGSNPGDPIYFNLESVEFKNIRGEQEALSFESLLSLLVHELGHHVSTKSHEFLDHLGIKFANYIKDITTSGFIRFYSEMGLYTQPPFFSYHVFSKKIDFPYHEAADLLAIGDDLNFIFLNSWIETQLSCQTGLKPKGYKIKTISVPMPGFSLESKKLFFSLDLSVILNCGGEAELKNLRWTGAFHAKTYKISEYESYTYYLFAHHVH